MQPETDELRAKIHQARKRIAEREKRDIWRRMPAERRAAIERELEAIDFAEAEAEAHTRRMRRMSMEADFVRTIKELRDDNERLRAELAVQRAKCLNTKPVVTN